MALKTGMKTCTGCKKTKCFNEFYVNKNSKCMYRTECKTCHSAKNKQNYKKNKEKIAQNYKKNKEKIIQKSAERYKKNREKLQKSEKYIENQKIMAEKAKHRSENRKKYLEEYNKKNKDKIKTRSKEYNKINKEKVAKQKKIYREKNKEKIAVKNKEYEKNNKEKIKARRKRNSEKRNERTRKRHVLDPCFRLRRIVANSVRKAFVKNGFSKGNNSLKNYLPYTFEELVKHIENQFEAWMNWENHGIYNNDTWNDNDQSTWTWHIDHIIPHSKFYYDSMKHPDFQKCWALSNLRPLSSKNNILKGNKDISEFKYGVAA